MKKLYVKDIEKLKTGSPIELYGWISRLHLLKNLLFIDIADSTGKIQTIIEAQNKDIPKIKPEDAVYVEGKLKITKGKREIHAKKIQLVGTGSKGLTPSPRSNFDIFDPKLSNFLNKNRHLYIRNPKMIHIMRMRHVLLEDIRKWFSKNGFIELNAPILSQNTLYDEESAISLKINNRKVFLTQCVGYYLEASVHALEKVYNIGPSFRAQESHTKRHLMEYWHVKAEIAFTDLEDMIDLVEKFLYQIFKSMGKINEENQKILGKKIPNPPKIPFPRISYEDAIKYLNKNGSKVKFGDHIGPDEEAILQKKFKNGAYWITGNARSIEPFPYSLDLSNEKTVKTADLIINGYGELLGVAEKISDIDMLMDRMKEKKRHKDKRYDWIREVHQMGPIPHAAVGMGLERLMRWLFGIPHVKDAIPFPRSFRRTVYP